jgi:hypothetical protein
LISTAGELSFRGSWALLFFLASLPELLSALLVLLAQEVDR